MNNFILRDAYLAKHISILAVVCSFKVSIKPLANNWIHFEHVVYLQFIFPYYPAFLKVCETPVCS